MPRPRKTDRPKRLEVQLPESVYSKLHLELYSDLEGRVPHGSTSELFTALAAEWLKSRGVVL